MEYSGDIKDSGGHFAIVASRWNEYITQGLVTGALEAFTTQGIDKERIDQIWVPGALEIPLVAQHLAQTKKYSALITLGCVVKGETAHFDIVAQESCRHLTELALEWKIPILLGVLTTYTMDQAIARSSPDDNNKGAECVLSALSLVNLLKKLPA